MTTTRQQGLGLVELMIAITLGLVVIGGVLTLFLSTLNSNKDMVGVQLLQNELHATLGLITRDLRRAGSDGKASALPDYANPFGLGTLSAYPGAPINSCLLFSYDLNGNGILDTGSTDERLGYRLKDGVVQRRKNGLDCSAQGWEDITTASTVSVTRLVFAVSKVSAGDMDIQRIDISLAGQLKSDPGIARGITRSLRVRNDARSP